MTAVFDYISDEKIDRLMEKYGFKTRPFKHQAYEFLKHRKDPERAMLWSMRTGKSKATIDQACYAFSQGKIDAVLVVAPNGVHENWIMRQIPEHHWENVPRRAMAWKLSALSGKKFADGWHGRYTRFIGEKNRLFWFAVNSESITNVRSRKIIYDFMKKRRVLLVVDECDDFKTPGSKRTQMMRAVKRRAVMKRIMSGTTTLESPLDSFSQFELLKDNALGFQTYADFEKEYVIYEIEKSRGGKTYPVLKEYKNLDDLQKRIAKWSTVVLREDCSDLPDLMRVERFLVPTAAQLKIYRKLHREFEIEVGRKTISVGESAAKWVKLQQVLSGWVKDEFGDVHMLPGENPRLEALVDEMSWVTGQSIIWCVFRRDIAIVKKRLKKEGLRVVEYHGGCSNAEKNKAVDGFQRGRYDAFIGQPDAGGRGLDLSAASLIVNYSHTFKARTRAQSEERGSKVGKEKMVVVDLLVPNSIDTHIRGVVGDKIDISSMLTGDGLKKLIQSTRL